MKHRLRVAVTLGIVMILVPASLGFGEERQVKDNEVRTGWGLMYGYARRVAPVGTGSSLWVSYDSFSVSIGIFGPDTLKGSWALASIRTEPVKGRGFFAEAGAGWGRVTEDTGPSSPNKVTDGLGWQAALGYRFTPSWRLDLKAFGVEGESFAPWLTLAFNF